MPIYVTKGEVEAFTFPGGERHVRLPAMPAGPARIIADLRSSDDIMDLLLTADAIKALGLPIGDLEINYLPYARQDRIANSGEAHSLRVMARLINSIGADRVFLLDPHSYVAEALIDNVRVMPVQDIFDYAEDDTGGSLAGYVYDEDLVVVAPDAGAEKKVLKVAQLYGAQMEIASKIRDTKTGQIVATNFSVRGVRPIQKRPVLIVDDICDGGRTFLELAKVIRKNYDPSRIGLFVTHGLFTHEDGVKVFEGLIDDVFCVDDYTGANPLTIKKAL